MLLRLLAPCRRAASHGRAGTSLIAAASSNRSCSSTTSTAVEFKRLTAPEGHMYKAASRLAAPSIVVEQVEELEPVSSSLASSSSSSPVPAASASTAVVKHVGKNGKIVKVDEWAWRRARGVGVFRWTRFRRYLLRLSKGVGISDLDPCAPSSWLPKGASPFKMLERHAPCGQRYLAVSHVQIARMENYLDISGRASAAQMADISSASGLKKADSIHVGGRTVLAQDETFDELFEDLRRRNLVGAAARRRERDKVVEPGTDPSAKNPSSATAPPPAALSPSISPSSRRAPAADPPTTPPAVIGDLEDGRLDDLAAGLPDTATKRAVPAIGKPLDDRVQDVPARDASLEYFEVAKEASRVASRHFDLEATRLLYARAKQHGSAAFLSIDVEWWAAKPATLLTNVGWSSLEFVVDPKTDKVEERRDGLHAFVRENMRPDKVSLAANAKFAFGRSVALPQRALYHTLAALIHLLAFEKQLFLIFHDPRNDLRALDQLGFDTTRDFHTNLRMLEPAQGDARVARVVDTQRLFSAWVGKAPRVGLDKACAELRVRTDPKLFHHAGNDAHYTLALFERLMDRALRPNLASPLIAYLTERPLAASLEELQPSFMTSELEEMEEEEEGEQEQKEKERRDDDVEERKEEETSAPL